MNFSYFEYIIYNPGLYHVAINIFSRLNYDDLASCRLICKSANSLIENQTFWLKSVFAAILKKERKFWVIENEDSVDENDVQKDQSIIETFPWWKDFLSHVTNIASFSELQMLICVLQNYFHTEDLYHNASDMAPLMWVLNKSQDSLHLRFLEFFLDSSLEVMKDFEEPRSGFHGERNPFNIACGEGFVESARLFLKYAKNQSIDLCQNEEHCNSLHAACATGKLNAVKFLLENNDDIRLDVNKQDPYVFNTPLHEAVAVQALRHPFTSMDDSKQVVEFILENRTVYGINANLRNEDGLTPMALASKHNLHEIVQIFRNHGFENDENIE